MKKRLLYLGSMFAMAFASILGSGYVSTSSYSATVKESPLRSEPTGQGTSKQQLVRSDLAFALRATDRDYDLPFFYTNRNNRQRKWCNSFRAGHSNRIKLSRNTRRKHRRA